MGNEKKAIVGRVRSAPAHIESVQEVRARARSGFSRRIDVLEGIADSGESRDSDRIKALQVLAAVGVGPPPKYDPDLVGALGRAVAEHVSDPDALHAILARWRGILAEL